MCSSHTFLVKGPHFKGERGKHEIETSDATANELQVFHGP